MCSFIEEQYTRYFRNLNFYEKYLKSKSILKYFLFINLYYQLIPIIIFVIFTKQRGEISFCSLCLFLFFAQGALLLLFVIVLHCVYCFKPYYSQVIGSFLFFFLFHWLTFAPTPQKRTTQVEGDIPSDEDVITFFSLSLQLPPSSLFS